MPGRGQGRALPDRAGAAPSSTVQGGGYPPAPKAPPEEPASEKGVSVDPVDEDGDGFDSTATGGDCNDGDASVSPAASEVCDGVDNNCDGQIDEDVTYTFYADLDGDG